MIVLLLPSRGRPDNIARLHASLAFTTQGAWRMVVHRDLDDPAVYQDYPEVTYLYAERMLLSEYWNRCYEWALDNIEPDGEPPIYQHAGDDITFRTVGWDRIVKDAFPEDGIAFVHGDDLTPNGATLGTHGFLRSEWIDTLGYFVPPYFSSDFNDTWLTEVGDLLGRRVYVPIVTEHHHPAFGKAEWDLTHHERLGRGSADDVLSIWNAHAPDRYMDAAKLRAKMVTP